MGYRSDVRIITSRKGYEQLRKYVDKYLADKKYKYGNLLDNLDLNKETKYAKYFGWDSVKWYENCGGYEVVDAIMTGLKYLKDNDYSYRYARIGESYDDYEEFSYESEIEGEQNLEYPSLNRSFDDAYVIDNMKSNDFEPKMN